MAAIAEDEGLQEHLDQQYAQADKNPLSSVEEAEAQQPDVGFETLVHSMHKSK